MTDGPAPARGGGLFRALYLLLGVYALLVPAATALIAWLGVQGVVSPWVGLAALGAPRANQGAVSRALRSCRLWIESGGHVPDPPRMPQASPRRARTMDPSKLEQGSGRRSQRPRSEESE